MHQDIPVTLKRSGETEAPFSVQQWKIGGGVKKSGDWREGEQSGRKRARLCQSVLFHPRCGEEERTKLVEKKKATGGPFFQGLADSSAPTLRRGKTRGLSVEVAV